MIEDLNLILLSKLNLLQEQLHLLINKSKQNYFIRMASKLTNVQKNSKTYRSLLNHFLIDHCSMKTNLWLILKKMPNFLMHFFAKKWYLIKNSSKLPSHYHYLTDNHLSYISFSQDDIAKIVQFIDPVKML